MPRTFSILDRAKRQNKLWTPMSDHPRIGPYWDVSHPPSVGLTTTAATSLYDRGGATRCDAVQGFSSAFAPTFVEDALNGCPVASYGASHVQGFTPNNWVLSGTDWCVVTVVKMNANTQVIQYLVGGIGVGIAIGGNPGYDVAWVSSNGAVLRTPETSPTCLGQWRIFSLTPTSIYRDGSDTSAYFEAGSAWASTTFSQISGRPDVSNPDLSIRADLAQLVCGPLSLRERMEGDAARKWFGDNNPLPAGHPYRNRPPLLEG